MTRITERCSALQNRIERFTQRESLQSQAEVLYARRVALDGARQSMAVALDRAAVLSQADCLKQEPSWPKAARTLAAIAGVRARLADDPSTLAAGQDYKRLLTGIEAATKAVEKSVNDAWQSVLSTSDPVDDRLLARLAQVPGQADKLAKLRALREELAQLGSEPPSTTDHYDQFSAKASELAELWNGLDHGDLPDAVVNFFKASQGGKGADESMWTPEVRDWLKERGMLKSVRIFMKKGS